MAKEIIPVIEVITESIESLLLMGDGRIQGNYYRINCNSIHRTFFPRRPACTRISLTFCLPRSGVRWFSEMLALRISCIGSKWEFTALTRRLVPGLGVQVILILEEEVRRFTFPCHGRFVSVS